MTGPEDVLATGAATTFCTGYALTISIFEELSVGLKSEMLDPRGFTW